MVVLEKKRLKNPSFFANPAHSKDFLSLLPFPFSLVFSLDNRFKHPTTNQETFFLFACNIIQRQRERVKLKERKGRRGNGSCSREFGEWEDWEKHAPEVFVNITQGTQKRTSSQTSHSYYFLQLLSFPTFSHFVASLYFVRLTYYN